MGKASRRRRRRGDGERILREVGVVYVSGPDGEDVVVQGPEADGLRALMTSLCPLCASGGH